MEERVVEDGGWSDVGVVRVWGYPKTRKPESDSQWVSQNDQDSGNFNLTRYVLRRNQEIERLPGSTMKSRR